MTELLELPELELELSDEQLQDISGGCAGTTLQPTVLFYWMSTQTSSMYF